MLIDHQRICGQDRGLDTVRANLIPRGVTLPCYIDYNLADKVMPWLNDQTRLAIPSTTRPQDAGTPDTLFEAGCDLFDNRA
jgi:hypothetical protein